MIIYEIEYSKDNIKFLTIGGDKFEIKIGNMLWVKLGVSGCGIIEGVIKYHTREDTGIKCWHELAVSFDNAAILYKLMDEFVLQEKLPYDAGVSFPTQSARRVYHFIDTYIEFNKVPPTLREIAKGINISSSGVVSRYVNQLVEDGFLVRTRVGKRNLKPVPLFKLRQL